MTCRVLRSSRFAHPRRGLRRALHSRLRYRSLGTSSYPQLARPLKSSNTALVLATTPILPPDKRYGPATASPLVTDTAGATPIAPAARPPAISRGFFPQAFRRRAPVRAASSRRAGIRKPSAEKAYRQQARLSSIEAPAADWIAAVPSLRSSAKTEVGDQI